MKTVIVREYGDVAGPCGYLLDLRKITVRNCTGCWSCWQKTPGRCAQKDLDEFYRAFLAADRVIFFLKSSHGFVSGNVKSLFDRMIPHYLPYTSYATGESMHEPRYEQYPDAEVYYEDTFETEEERELYTDYLNRVFYQFHISCTVIRPAGEYAGNREAV
ncbi:flavodoxin family protein [Breznakiella homolactica]|uniref:Flavodoxin family protein n=1 Tax=Breznakiella homolactica TaxID=2798577 RepID=A0A7T7XJY8_9SPIR|nr:flavodoxin family protein [Breznakiella homolactica]QQO07756.1 flavodoxin family protein [Breznakiella homolactica]